MPYDSGANIPMPAYKDVIDELYHAVADLIKENQALRMELEAANAGRLQQMGDLEQRAQKTLVMIKERNGHRLPLNPTPHGDAGRGKWE